MNLEVVPVVSITVICYLVGAGFKAVGKFDKYIPVFVGLCGAALGLAAWLTIPSFPADTWLTALEIGIASGLASTGVNQVFKQLRKEE